ncbi:hypothetical protein IV79_GL001125 [Pediococcus claussenii]|nr:hypothetical protein IV79_GL001125 [Pediococcus claussenii]
MVQTVHASTQKVLVVYDSQNVSQDGNRRLDTLQRLMASYHFKVTTIKLNSYKQGEIKKEDYQGVISLINWPEAHINNQQYDHDLQLYSGIKLHIGQNISDSEQTGLKVKLKQLYHQQLTISGKSGTSQLLPFTDSMQVVPQSDSKHGQSFGTLISQGDNSKRYAYGWVEEKSGYLPFIANDGLSMLLAAQTIGNLFDCAKQQHPLLTITDVTPYSDLNQLSHLTSQLFGMGIPFAVSVRSVADNTNLKAFDRFTAVLRKIENQNGVVFLQTPETIDPSTSSGNELKQLMQDYFISLGRKQVLPVGISATNEWNQNEMLRTNGLEQANRVLLLPNSSKFQDDGNKLTAGIADTNYFAMSLKNFQTVHKLTDESWTIPTSVTVKTPSGTQQTKDTLDRIDRLKIDFLDPASSDQSMEISAGALRINYLHGNYTLNGEPVTISQQNEFSVAPNKTKTTVSAVNRFFKFQSNIMLIFFGFVLIILVVFIVLGRRIYRGMFTRRQGGKHH